MVNLDGISGNTQLPAGNFGKSLCFWGLLGDSIVPASHDRSGRIARGFYEDEGGFGSLGISSAPPNQS